MPHHAHVPDFSFRPIRARIAATLGEQAPEMTRAQVAEMTTDICLVVATIADGRQALWLAAGQAPQERDALHILAEGQALYPEEIQAIRTMTATLTAAGLALGFPVALVQERINAKLCREFFELPSGTR